MYALKKLILGVLLIGFSSAAFAQFNGVRATQVNSTISLPVSDFVAGLPVRFVITRSFGTGDSLQNGGVQLPGTDPRRSVSQIVQMGSTPGTRVVQFCQDTAAAPCDPTNLPSTSINIISIAVIAASCQLTPPLATVAAPGTQAISASCNVTPGLNAAIASTDYRWSVGGPSPTPAPGATATTINLSTPTAAIYTVSIAPSYTVNVTRGPPFNNTELATLDTVVLPSVTSTITAQSALNVAITTPANNAIFTAPATIPLASSLVPTNTGTGGRGVTTRVDYLVNNAVIGSGTSATFAFSWQNVPAGTYAVTPRLFTSLGTPIDGAPINVIVYDPPTVTITSPNNNAGVVAPTPINLSANVTSSTAVTSVEYFANGVTVGQATVAPFKVTWLPSQLGSYSLTAVITNQVGQKATSGAVTIFVSAPPVGSVVCAINSPAAIAIADQVTLTAACTRNFKPLNAAALSPDESLRYDWGAGAGSPAVPPGTTGDTLKFAGRTFPRAGTYTYSVTATISNRRFPPSTATSNAVEATVTVKSQATSIEVTSPPSSLKVTPGGPINVTVVVKDGATPVANQLVSWKIVGTDEKRARAKSGVQKAGCTQAADSPSSNEFTTNQNGEGVITFTASCATGGRSLSVTAAGFTRPPILLTGPDQLVSGVTTLNGVSQINAEPSVATPVSVKVVDSSNVGLEGSTTTWTINPAAAGTVSGTVISNKDGVATATLALNAGFAKAELEACIQGSPSGTANKCQKIQVRNVVTAVAEPGNAIIKPIMQQAVDAPRVQLNNIRNRLQQLRVEETSGGGSDRGDGGVKEKTGLGLFVLGEVDFAKRQSGTDTTYKLRTKGITIGADYRAQKNLVIGGAFGALVGDTTLTGGSQKTKGYSASVFGQWLPGPDWYVNAIANIGRNNIDNSRTSIGGDNLTGRAVTSQQAVQVEAGYALAKGGARFTPFVRYEMIRAKLKPFEERGGVDALAIGGQTVRANTFGVGAIAEYAISTSNGVWIPSGRVEFLSESQKQGAAYARLVNGTPVLVPLSVEAIDKSYGTWGLNLQWLTGPSGNLISSFIGYEQTFGKTGFSNNRFTAGVKIPF